LSDLEAEAATLTSDLDPTALASLQRAAVEKQARLAAVRAQLAALSNAVNPQASGGFLRDVLSDAYGISFHRFQMFVWTVVLWLLFLASVWTRLSMPEFSATLLAMLGVSAGTYLGFKIPEKDA
jgi:hypothetical protein